MKVPLGAKIGAAIGAVLSDSPWRSMATRCASMRFTLVRAKWKEPRVSHGDTRLLATFGDV